MVDQWETELYARHLAHRREDTMKRPFIDAAVLAAIGLVTVIALGCGRVLAGRPGAGVPPPPTPWAVGTPLPAPTIPTLTEEEVARAQEIFASDPRTERLLDGHPYVVEGIFPWLKSSNEIIGAWLSVSLTTPVDVEGEWPGMDYDETEETEPPYEEGTTRMEVRGLRRVDVLVDLQRGRMVSINPSEYTELIFLEEIELLTPPPEYPGGE